MKKLFLHNKLKKIRKELMNILKDLDKNNNEEYYTYLFQAISLIFKVEYKINKEILDELKRIRNGL